MEQELFDDLVQSLKEARAMRRGEMPASRRITVATPDTKAVREQIGLSGPAAALLKIVRTAPDMALKTLRD